jgi:hypothetical protein
MRNNMLMAAAKRADAAGAVALEDGHPGAAPPVSRTPEAPVAVATPPVAVAPLPGTVEAKLRDAQTRVVGGVRVMEPAERLVPTVHLAVRIPKPTHSAIRTWATRVDMTIQEFVLSAVGELMQRLAEADEQV